MGHKMCHKMCQNTSENVSENSLQNDITNRVTKCVTNMPRYDSKFATRIYYVDFVLECIKFNLSSDNHTCMSQKYFMV